MVMTPSDTYRLEVARALRGEASDPVYNGTIEHAAIVIEEAFLTAKSRVRILSNHLEAACYNCQGVREAAVAFVSRPGTQLDLLVEEGAEAQDALGREGFLRDVIRAGGDRVSLRVVPRVAAERYAFNFLLVDDSAYRYQQDRSQHMAVVAGGDAFRRGLDNLARSFEALRVVALPIPSAQSAGA